MNKLLLWASPVLCCLFTTANAVFAQDTAFTYQGRLNNNGSPANGSYDPHQVYQPNPHLAIDKRRS